MDKFHDRQHVRLRSRVHGTYLHANNDGQSVSLRRRRATLETAWTVHIYHGEGDAVYLLLHSAAYGRYLAATATRAPLGHLGFRAELRDYDQPEVEAIMWQAVEAGSGGDVMLLNAGGRYLRANGSGRHLPWNTRVSVDDVGNISTMMCWTVQTVPSRVYVPIPHHPVRPPNDWFGLKPGVWRTIRFVRANEEGFYTEEGWTAFPFRGRSVHYLRDELSTRVNLHLFNLVSCVRAGRYGRPTPLVVNLPHGGSGETLEIVVIQSGTPGYAELQHLAFLA